MATSGAAESFWGKEELERLVYLYQNQPDLWDIQCPNYSKKDYRTHALARIQAAFDNTCSGYDKIDGGGEQRRLPKDLEDSLKAVTFRGDRDKEANRYIEQTKQCITRFVDVDSTFVETKACTVALEEFRKNKCITISGNIGDGKTTVAYYILSKMVLEGYDVISITSPELIEQLYNPDDKLVCFVDDAFGTPTLSNQLVDSWLRLHEKLNVFVKSGNFGLILATRKQVLIAGHIMLEGLDCFNNVLDLTDSSIQLNQSEKIRILQNHCRSRKVELTENILNRSRHYSLSGFPLMCRLYAADFRLQDVDDFFEKPLAVLRKHVQVLAKTDPMAFCGLVLIMMYDGDLSETVFDVFNVSRDEQVRFKTIKEACSIEASVPLAKIEDALQPLISVYIVSIDGHYKFIHDSIFDTVTLVFGEKYPKEIIKICTPEFLCRRVRAEHFLKDSRNTQTSDDKLFAGAGWIINSNDSDVIYVPTRCYKDIAVRFLQDIMSGYISEVFNNRTIFVTAIQGLMVKEIQKLSQHHLKILLIQKDRSSNSRLMYFVCKAGIITLAECLIGQGIEVNSDLMVAACEANQFPIIEILNKHGIDINGQSDRASSGVTHLAAFKGNVSLLRNLIGLGADIHVRNWIQAEPLSFACKNGKYEMVKFLLEQGADPVAKDVFGRHPIHYAASAGCIDCVQILTKHGADSTVNDSVQCQPIHFAAESENPALVEYLLGNGCDPNAATGDGKRPLHCACRWDRVETVKLLLKNGADLSVKDVRGKQPLHIACETNSECIGILLGMKNIEINTKDNEGMTPLHRACSHSSQRGYDHATLLVEMGADIHSSDESGMQPLTYACDHNATETAKFLISKGADVNWRAFLGRQAIHFVVAEGNTELTKLLASKGADINAKAQNSMKPIHFACKYDAISTLTLLLDMGVDPNERDLADYTPLFYACLQSNVDVVKVLLRRGADPLCKDYLQRQAPEMIHLIGDKGERIRKLFDSVFEQLDSP